MIATLGATDRSEFVIPANGLCGSPVLKDYLDQPDTVPRDVARHGTGTLTLNTSSDTMRAVLEHLKQKHGDHDFVAQTGEHGVTFYAQLYKIGLCLG